ncbi:MFS transporter [Patescibacteria group bacterium]|nr:MFS transporter [Patescibacteria group bacterium]MBU1705467.1 MFS transporter [Patescibacteria group bacterium]
MPFHPFTSHPFCLPRQGLSPASLFPTLVMNRLIGFLSGSLLNLFFPIFLYQILHFSIQYVLLWYGLNYLIRIPFFVPGSKLFTRFGLVPAMVVGTIGAFVFHLCVYLLSAGATEIWFWLSLAAIGLAFNNIFYWSPFHVDFAQMTVKDHRGRQISRFYAIHQLISFISPIISGYVIAVYGFSFVFLFATILQILSLAPLAYLPNSFVKYEFGYWETLRKLVSKKYRNMCLAMAANGAENLVGVIIWPIFLFMIFDGQYLDLGVFASVIIMISLMLELFIGKKTDSKSKRKLLRLGTGIYSLGWVAKAAVSTVVGVFAAATFHSFGSILLRTPLAAVIYEQAADSGHYIDEYTVLREIGLNIGRVLMVVVLMLLMHWFSIAWSFVIAAVVSLGMTKIGQRVS